MTLANLPLVRDVPGVTAAQVAEVDRITTGELHVPVEALMENAAHQIAVAARAYLGGSVAGKRIIGLVGTGNNGGDVAGALRHLLNWGAAVSAECVAAQSDLRETTRVQLVRLMLGTTWREAIVHDASVRGPRDLEASLLIDGLLGYSSHGPARDSVAKLIDAANGSGAPILAADIPSGLDPDTGGSPGVVVRAAATVTLALPKKGLVRPIAREAVGELLVADIGIPYLAFARIGVDARHVFEQADLVRVAV